MDGGITLRPEIRSYLDEKPELKYFLRAKPIWYRRLTRNPQELSNFESDAKKFHGKTIPQKIQKVGNQMQMASMLFQMFNTPDETKSTKAK